MRVSRKYGKPLHEVGDAGIGVFFGGGEEEWQRRMRAQKIASVNVGDFREQHQRFDFGVLHRQVHGLVDAAAGPAHDEKAWRDRWLRDQKFVSGFHVRWHLFVEHRLDLFRRELVDRRAFRIAVAAQVHRHHVHAGRRHAPGKVVPYLALTVALVQQKHAGPRRGGAPKRALELQPVGSR